MTRLVASLILAITMATPALAQVINGETPLDETTLDRRTPGPAAQPFSPATRSTTDAAEPSRSDPPPAPRRD